MKYVLLDERNVVIQVQPDKAIGFVKAPDDVYPNMIKQENGTYNTPAPDPDPED